MSRGSTSTSSCGGSSMAGSSPDLFRLTLAHLYLWLLQRQVQLITPAGATSQALNAAVQMLEAAASLAADLAEHGHSMAAFEAACLAARNQLEEAADARAQAAAAKAMLPELSSPGTAAKVCGPGSYRCPRGKPPPERSARREGGGLEAAQGRAAENLGSLPLPGGGIKGTGAAAWVHSLLAAVQEASAIWRAGGGDVAAQHALSMVEHELFQRAASAKLLQAAASLGSNGVQALADVLDIYRTGESPAAPCCIFSVPLACRLYQLPVHEKHATHPKRSKRPKHA